MLEYILASVWAQLCVLAPRLSQGTAGWPFCRKLRSVCSHSGPTCQWYAKRKCIDRLAIHVLGFAPSGHAWNGCISIRRRITYTCKLLSAVEIPAGIETTGGCVYFLQVYSKQKRWSKQGLILLLPPSQFTGRASFWCISLHAFPPPERL